MHVNAAIAFARDRAGDVVANAERAIAFALAFAQRAQRISGLAALADGEDQRVAASSACCDGETRWRIPLPSECWRAVRSDIRRPCAACSAVPQPVRTTRPTSRNSRRRHVQSAELGGAFFGAEPAAHGVAHRIRLLKDFLEHVMRDNRPCLTSSALNSTLLISIIAASRPRAS